MSCFFKKHFEDGHHLLCHPELGSDGHNGILGVDEQQGVLRVLTADLALDDFGLCIMRVEEINEAGQAVILSSREGYRLKDRSYSLSEVPTENEARIWRVLSDLLTSKEGINAFDEADALYVSASTVINNIIPQIKAMVREYDLRVESQKFQFYLRGSELNKRRLIGRIATDNSYGFFNTRDALEQLFPSQDIPGLMQKLYIICQEAKLYLNDFAMNNLLIHLLVILIRLRSNDDLEEKGPAMPAMELLEKLRDREMITGLAGRIGESFARDYGIRIPERDYQQILALIALSVEHDLADIQTIVSQTFIEEIAALLSQVSQRYCTPEFSNDFVQQFSLHMYYAQQRCAFCISYPNPIASQFKRDYAPIYDMAVFFAHQFVRVYNVAFNEDEIAFIAFHFGAFLESNKQNQGHISCAVVVESYHSLSKRLVDELTAAFSGRLAVTEVLAMNRFLRRTPECDLIITTLPLPDTGKRTVRVNPILTKQNLAAVREVLDEIDSEREHIHARAFLQQMLYKDLYFRNVEQADVEGYIRFLGDRCRENGCAGQEFIEDVLRRESFSSTAFTDVLAVPHAISRYADRSFIGVIHNDAPIPWSGRMIHFILLVGIAEQDMKHFKAAFDLIIDLFSSPERTLELLRTDTFEEFCSHMK